MEAVMETAEAKARLSREIDRIVTNAARAGSIVRTGYYAGMLANTYGDTGFSVRRIINEIALAAGRRGVPVEIGQRDSEAA